MRIQGWGGFAVAGLCVLAFVRVTVSGGDDDRTFVFLWLFFAAFAALGGAGLLSAAKAVGLRRERATGVAAELLVLFLGAWAWPLAPLTILAPLYVLVLLGGVQPQ